MNGDVEADRAEAKRGEGPDAQYNATFQLVELTLKRNISKVSIHGIAVFTNAQTCKVKSEIANKGEENA